MLFLLSIILFGTKNLRSSKATLTRFPNCENFLSESWTISAENFTVPKTLVSLSSNGDDISLKPRKFLQRNWVRIPLRTGDSEGKAGGSGIADFEKRLPLLFLKNSRHPTQIIRGFC